MILSSQITEADVDQMIHFYRNHYEVVDLVKCEKCGSFLAFELMGGDSMGVQPNEIGKVVIPIGDKLKSHRIRLDEAPTGERMVGYQCECGNDSRIASIERGDVPAGSALVYLSPFEKHQIMEKIKTDKKYKPKFKVEGKKKHFDNFSVERV